mmetsp:Transcript_10381/g.24999  ORF Transcript_10381/g.24999 Transcript_10381/m.24999 type:complete len:344 (+) Transcript_10381:32-1063(+)
MVEDLLKQAETFKEEGNRLHKEGDYRRALGAYHKVFCFVNGLVPPPAGQKDTQDVQAGSNQIPRDRVEEVNKLKQATRLNMAACYLKVKDFQKCVNACTAALELGAQAKAYFRRAQAYVELRNLSDAASDLERARALAPEDASILAQLRQVRRSMKQGDEEERQRYAGMFFKTEAEVTEAEPEDQASTALPAAGQPEKEEQEASERKAPEAPTPARAERAREARNLDQEVPDEAKKLECTVKELTYAWQQTDAEVKVYISFDQCDELASVKESQVKAEFGEWSASVVIQMDSGVPFGLRLADFHRRVAPERCKCTVRSSRITLKLVKQESEHWWNLLQNASPG